MRVNCIFVNEARNRILLVPAYQGWELPGFDVRLESVDPYDTAFLHKLVKSLVPWNIEPLYAMDFTEAGQTSVLAVFEALGYQLEPAGHGDWFKREDALGNINDSRQKSFAASCLSGNEMNTEKDFMPWLAGGWFREAEAWILEQLAAPHISINSSPVHVKSSFLGKVLRIDTGKGTVYFKAVPRFYNREIAITRALFEWRPKRIPEPIIVDPRRGWMLLGEIKGPTLAQVDREETWQETIRTYARLQRDSIRFINEHPANPFFDMRRDSICPGIDRMLKNLPKLQAGYTEPLGLEEIKVLHQLSPKLKRACVEMESYSVPCALEHGDLHPGNIRITKDGPVFLDWAWSCVTNPFLSVFQLLHERKMPGELNYVRDRLLWTYLREWLDYTYDDRLKALYQLAEKWRFIQYAVADAEWLSSYLKELSGKTIDQGSYLAWTISRRQYYLVKSLRRILEIWGETKPVN